jgi:regulator of protease activity HflC (stomatin/prohibitin superfamily)
LNLFRRTYISDDLELLDKRVSVAVNTSTAAEIQARDLAVVLRNFDQIAASVMDRLRANQGLAPFGVEVLSLTITSIRPTPEVAKAMEAALREELLRRADEAIFARRSAAIAEERKIKEQELATDLAMEAKRQELIALAGANQVEEAEARGRSHAAESAYELERLRTELELWRGLDPQLIAALGFRSLASQGADNLTITTEVLSALMNAKQS